MKREDWLCVFKRDYVKEASQAKLTYHEGRLAFWQGKQDEVMAGIKADGLEIETSVAGAQYSQASNYSRGPQVVVRDDYQRDLQECNDKVREHTLKVQKYKSWLAFLSAPGPAEIELDSDDYAFFFNS